MTEKAICLVTIYFDSQGIQKIQKISKYVDKLLQEKVKLCWVPEPSNVERNLVDQLARLGKKNSVEDANCSKSQIKSQGDEIVQGRYDERWSKKDE